MFELVGAAKNGLFRRVAIVGLSLVMWASLGSASLAQPLVGRVLYAGPRGTTVVAPSPGPGPLDPLSVAYYWGLWPNPVIARQPIGHQTIATSHNGYVYRPVYADDASAASIAMPNALEATGGAPPMLRAPAGPPSTDALFEAALALFKAGRYEAAIDRLNRVLNQKRDHGDACLLLVQAYFGLANYEAAADALSAALAVAPEYNWEKYARGYRKYFASPLRFAMHLRTLERFVELNPDRVEGHLLIGYEYGSLGKTDQALAELALAHPNMEGDKLTRHFTENREGPAPGPDEEFQPAPPAAAPPPIQRRGRAF